jgi:hypothetical protein
MRVGMRVRVEGEIEVECDWVELLPMNVSNATHARMARWDWNKKGLPPKWFVLFASFAWCG